MSIDSATVIIRSVGERTEDLCRKIILNQGVPESNIFIVREVPFSAAMKKSFEVGIDHGLTWTLCVDADILLREDTIYKMIKAANKQRDNVCEIQGFVLDKFFGGVRQAGQHLYRTSLLPKVIKAIPAEGDNIRPETHALNMMKKMGFPWRTIALLTGLHDFEQYNRDILRKSIVHSHKHLNWMEVFVPYWKEMAKTDCDYDVALSGLAAGIMNYEKVFINVEQPIYHELFLKANIKEKPKLCAGSYNINEVERIISQWQEPEEYISRYSNINGLDIIRAEVMIQKSKLGTIKRKTAELGFIKTFPWLFGRFLRRSGDILCSYIEGAEK